MGSLMLGLLRSNVIDLPVSVSLSNLWCGGFMLWFFLGLQVLSGIVLACVFDVGELTSFRCVVGVTLDGYWSWLVRYIHIWGVSFIFFFLYFHLGRSLYYSSYTKSGVWNVGFLLYLLMMVEAFLGYVLPWHQMSYWAATVLTSILSSIPLFGDLVYMFVVGGFSVTEVTLLRAYPVHVCLAFVIVGLGVVHMFYLHKGGSSCPLVVNGGYSDVVSFHSYFSLKDGCMLAVSVFVYVFSLWSFPDIFMDAECFTPADPLMTPSSIKPEWYFLGFYAMLRSVESKLGGLILVLLFLFLLWLPVFNYSCVYWVDRQCLFWLGVSLFLLLTYVGFCHPEAPFLGVAKLGGVALVVVIGVFKGLWLVPYSYCGGFSRFTS